jgi:glucose-6-phosphate isomerase
MFLTYFDTSVVSPAIIKKNVKALAAYRSKVTDVIKTNDSTVPEYSLAHVANESLHDQLDVLKREFKGISHLVLVGIGGSNLGTQAVHDVLDVGKVKLLGLDTVSATDIQSLLAELRSCKSAKKIAICVISKSGGTAETVSNAGVLLSALEEKFGKTIYQQTLFIGNPGTDFMAKGKRLGVQTIAMPEVVGGRYSVTTEVGLVPLTLLGHDVDAFIQGIFSNIDGSYNLVGDNALRYTHMDQKETDHVKDQHKTSDLF